MANFLFGRSRIHTRFCEVLKINTYIYICQFVVDSHKKWAQFVKIEFVRISQDAQNLSSETNRPFRQISERAIPRSSLESRQEISPVLERAVALLNRHHCERRPVSPPNDIRSTNQPSGRQPDDNRKTNQPSQRHQVDQSAFRMTTGRPISPPNDIRSTNQLSERQAVDQSALSTTSGRPISPLKTPDRPISPISNNRSTNQPGVRTKKPPTKSQRASASRTCSSLESATLLSCNACCNLAPFSSKLDITLWRESDITEVSSSRAVLNGNEMEGVKSRVLY